jgi:hypothetical protein
MSLHLLTTGYMDTLLQHNKITTESLSRSFMAISCRKERKESSRRTVERLGGAEALPCPPFGLRCTAPQVRAP